MLTLDVPMNVLSKQSKDLTLFKSRRRILHWTSVRLFSARWLSSLNVCFLEDPSAARISRSSQGSRWIFVQWSLIHPRTFFQSFDVLVNRTRTYSRTKSQLSINLTEEILPFREWIRCSLPRSINEDLSSRYQLRIVTRSTFDSFSEPLIIKTLPEGLDLLSLKWIFNENWSLFLCLAPSRPSEAAIREKIVFRDDHVFTTGEEYLMEIDRTLFNEDYGNITSYSIYIRQGSLLFSPLLSLDADRRRCSLDVNKSSNDLGPIGSYSQSLLNRRLDYFAFRLVNPRSSRMEGRWTLLLGNDTECASVNDSSLPCNGKLQFNRIYQFVLFFSPWCLNESMNGSS